MNAWCLVFGHRYGPPEKNPGAPTHLTCLRCDTSKPIKRLPPDSRQMLGDWGRPGGGPTSRMTLGSRFSDDSFRQHETGPGPELNLVRCFTGTEDESTRVGHALGEPKDLRRRQSP